MYTAAEIMDILLPVAARSAGTLRVYLLAMDTVDCASSPALQLAIQARRTLLRSQGKPLYSNGRLSMLDFALSRNGGEVFFGVNAHGTEIPAGASRLNELAAG